MVVVNCLMLMGVPTISAQDVALNLSMRRLLTGIRFGILI
jgi:hypothetical protein